MRAKELPADLIREWAIRQTKASAKLEGRELPESYAPSEKLQEFFAKRHAERIRTGGLSAPSESRYG